MTDALLLPSSSTKLERDLSSSMDALPRLGAAAELIRDAKRENIPDSVVPFLLYEYGLGELLPYLSDPRTAISTGVLWQRLRGTPKSFSIALGWIGNDGTIEESEGNTINWSQFQLGLDSAPVDLSQTDSVVEIGRLSSPVRSSLFRIYGGWYDGRRFQLDNHQLSGLDTLCDHTGVYLKDEWPQLSFGREFKDEQGDISGDLAAILGIHRATGISGRYEDRTILSNSVLGDTSWRTLHIEDLSSVISRLHFSVSGPWWNNATDWSSLYDYTQVFDWAGLQNKFTPALKFARAGMYLSDYAELGDTNACFPARSLDEFGDGAILLSEADPATGEHILSEHLSRVEFTEINERIERGKEFGSLWVGQYQTQTEIFPLTHGQAYTAYDSTNVLPHVTHIPAGNMRQGNYQFNNRQDYTDHIFGDGAGHALGNGEPFVSVATFTGQEVGVDVDSIQIDELAGTITAQKVLYRSNYVYSNYSNHTLGDFVTFPLYDADGRRQTVRFGNLQTAPYNSVAVAGGVTGVWAGTFSVDLLLGIPVELLPSHREHTREHLLYDDSFELSRSRLSEVKPLINEQANSRAHTTNALQTTEQSDQWQDTASNWGTEATGSWETVASYFDSLSQGDTWNSENWITGEYFGNADTDTWGNTFAWKVYPQLEQVLGFSRTMLTLSENGHLSDSDGILGDTHATLGHFEDERIERIHTTFAPLHPYGFGQGWEPLARLSDGEIAWVNVSSIQIIEPTAQIPQGEIRGTVQHRASDNWWRDLFDFVVPLYSANGDRRELRYENQHHEISYPTGIGTYEVAHVLFENLSLTSLKRERFKTLAYDDLFELSRTRLDEFIPLVNEQALSRGHYGVGSSDTAQSDQWQDTSSTWSTDATGSWATVTSYFDSLGEGDTWNTEDWNTGEYFANADTDTWANTFAWKVYPQIEQVLGFHKTHQYLSDNADGLSETHSVLGWPTSERFERDHYAEATENRQSFTTRQHTREYHPALVALYVEPTWAVGTWGGPDLPGWVQATTDWTDNSTNEWHQTNWPAELWAENSVSQWNLPDWIDSDSTTWATHQMWARMAGWQIASLVVEAVHQTHT